MSESKQKTQIQITIDLLNELSEDGGWVDIQFYERAKAARAELPGLMNVIWYCAREGYARVHPECVFWREWLDKAERGIRLPSVIPRELEEMIRQGHPMRMMILPRGELRGHQLIKEFGNVTAS